jgi:hypothetical protein
MASEANRAISQVSRQHRAAEMTLCKQDLSGLTRRFQPTPAKNARVAKLDCVRQMGETADPW